MSEFSNAVERAHLDWHEYPDNQFDRLGDFVERELIKGGFLPQKDLLLPTGKLDYEQVKLLARWILEDEKPK